MEGIVIIQAFIDKKGCVTETVVLQGIPNSGGRQENKILPGEKAGPGDRRVDEYFSQF